MQLSFDFLFLQLSKPVIDNEKTVKEHEDLRSKCRELRVQCLDLEKKKQLCKCLASFRCSFAPWHTPPDRLCSTKTYHATVRVSS